MPVCGNGLYRCIEFMDNSRADLLEIVHHANDFADQWRDLPPQRGGTSAIELSHFFSYIISVLNCQRGVFVVFLDLRYIRRNVNMSGGLQCHMTGGALLLVPGNGLIECGDGCSYVVSLLLAFAVLLCDLVQLATQFSQVIGAGFKCAFLGQQVAAALLVGSPINRRAA